MRPGVGGLPKETVQALFNKYDTDGSGAISYKEFVTALFADEYKSTQDAAPPKSLTGKTCYKDNEWLKAPTAFDGIFGGGSSNLKCDMPTTSPSKEDVSRSRPVKVPTPGDLSS